MRVTRPFALLLVGFAAGPLVHAQQVRDKPLGDVAREQRDTRKAGAKDSQKIYTNEDLTAPRIAESKSVATPSASTTDSKAPETAEAKQPEPADAKAPQSSPPSPQLGPTESKPQEAAQSPKPVVDRQDDTNGRSLVIPAGTQIKVDVSSPPYGPFPPEEGTVIASVYVGFSMGIPARSKVRLSSAPPADGTYSPEGSAYVWVAVTAVTLNGATYKVHTNALPLSSYRATKKLTFNLSKPLTIP